MHRSEIKIHHASGDRYKVLATLVEDRVEIVEMVSGPFMGQVGTLAGKHIYRATRFEQARLRRVAHVLDDTGSSETEGGMLQMEEASAD